MSQVATAMGRRWSFSVGTVGSTVIRIHLTFFLLLLWFGLASWFNAGPEAAVGAVIFLLLLFLCVVLHEFGHIFAAGRFGVLTPEVVLLPIGGVARLERIPEEPRAELLIAISGPAVTLAIALILIFLLGGLPAPDTLSELEGARALMTQLAYANAVLFVFNLIPAFPMDGGRILRAGLSTWFGHLRGTRIAANVGQGAAVLLGITGILSQNILLTLVAVFIFLAAGSERGIVELRGITSGHSAGESMITQFVTLELREPVSAAATALIRTEQKEFPIVDTRGRLRGLLTRDEIIHTISGSGLETPIAQVMNTNIPTVSRWTRMDEIVPKLASGAEVVFVTDDDDCCLGYITWQNLMEELFISRALDQSSIPRKEGTSR